MCQITDNADKIFKETEMEMLNFIFAASELLIFFALVYVLMSGLKY
ncbi:MAG: hypothetical protein ABIG95_01265 [Candidatus Woesearchaeota archaeon]